jgi:hypothetical protein
MQIAVIALSQAILLTQRQITIPEDTVPKDLYSVLLST